MDLIKLKHPINEQKIIEEDIVLILGFFDGVHLAHQKVIKEGVRQARELDMKAVLMTFNRHPKMIYEKIKPEEFVYLTQPEQKYERMKRLGVDAVYEIFFNSEFGHLKPQEFVDQYIIGLHAKVVVAGYDYTYGKPHIASMEHLPKYARGQFDIVQVGEARLDKVPISSTAIRNYIRTGEVEKANAMLGYSYETLGYVIHGDARGRELGYPTANIFSHPYSLLPGIGVYAVRLTVKGKKYKGMASVGYNVTFSNLENLSVEVNIFDFNEQIYGDDVKIEWVSYLRDEEKYESVEDLVLQLDQDKIDTLNILKD